MDEENRFGFGDDDDEPTDSADYGDSLFGDEDDDFFSSLSSYADEPIDEDPEEEPEEDFEEEPEEPEEEPEEPEEEPEEDSEEFEEPEEDSEEFEEPEEDSEELEEPEDFEDEPEEDSEELEEPEDFEDEPEEDFEEEPEEDSEELEEPEDFEDEPEEIEEEPEESEELEEETEEIEETDEESEELEEEPEEIEETDEEASDQPEEQTEENSEEEPESETAPAQAEKAPAISSDLIRGHINTIILRSLYDGDKYGYEIIAEIERKSHNQYSLKQPSLYSALKRLEKEGYVTSYWGGTVGGGRRKYFSLTDEGKEISERNQLEWEYSRTVIDNLISDKAFDFAQPAPAAVDMRMLKRSTSRVPDREEDDEEFEYDEPVEEEVAADLSAERAAFEAERQRYEESLRVREEVLRAREEAGTRREQELLEREFALREAEERLEAETALPEETEETSLSEETEAAPEAEETSLPEETEAAPETEETSLPEETEAAPEAEEPSLPEETEEAPEAEEISLPEETKAALPDFMQANAQTLAREKSEQNSRIVEMEPFAEERARYEQMLRDQEAQLRALYSQELAEQERRIREEDEENYRRREQQFIHENYLNLVNGAKPQESEEDLGTRYYGGMPAEEPPAEPDYVYVAKPEEEREYRSIIRRLFAGAVQETEPRSAPAPAAPVAPPAPAPAPVVPPAPAPAPAPAPVPKEQPEKPQEKPRGARPLNGVDFYDLESHAVQDGIRITTAGGRKKEEPQKPSESLVHRGKALFLSALVVFLLCLAEGSIALGFQNQLKLPRFYPFFIWGSGLMLLLVTGLMFINRYGERSLRRSGNILVNSIVGFALCVILILIVALASKIDFGDVGELTAYVILPAIYFFSIVVFGVAYYLQVKPLSED